MAAVDEATAEEALRAIRVEYEVLPAVFDFEAALADDAPQVHDDAPGNIAGVLAFHKGDVDAAFAEPGAVVVEGTFTTQRVHQCYMEPVACLMEWSADGRLTASIGSMNTSGLRQMLANALRLPISSVRVVQPPRRRIVRQQGDMPGHVSRHRLAGPGDGQAGADGQHARGGVLRHPAPGEQLDMDEAGLPARTAACWPATCGCGTTSAAYCEMAPAMLEVMSHRSDSLYRLPAVRADARMVYTNKSPIGAYRGFGNPQMTFAIEAQLDQMAVEIGMDPLEFRLKNASREGDVSVHGWELKSCGYPQALEIVRERSGWAKKRAERRPYRGLGLRRAPSTRATIATRPVSPVPRRRSRSSRTGTWWSRRARASSARGRTRRSSRSRPRCSPCRWPTSRCASPTPTSAPTPSGPGGRASPSAAATRSSSRPKRRGTACGRRPHSSGTSTSSGSPSTTGACTRKRSPARLATTARMARRDVRRRSLRWRRSPSTGWTGVLIRTEGIEEPPTTMMNPEIQTNPCSAYSFAAQVVEVTVDPLTGRVDVEGVWTANDCGTVLNPLMADAQVEASVLQGIGFALSEHMEYRRGHLRHAGFLGTGTPNASDMPPVDVQYTDTCDWYGPYGAKGVAELGQPPVPAAIAGAIEDAIGVRFTSLPITPEDVVRALEQRSRASDEKGARG